MKDKNMDENFIASLQHSSSTSRIVFRLHIFKPKFKISKKNFKSLLQRWFT